MISAKLKTTAWLLYFTITSNLFFIFFAAVLLLGAIVQAEPGIKGYSRIDAESKGTITTGSAHNAIHEGRAYYSDQTTTDLDDNTLQYWMTTPNTDVEMHLLFDADVSGAANLIFREGSGSAGGTSTGVIYNANRRSAATSSLVTVKNSSVGNESFHERKKNEQQINNKEPESQPGS